MTTLTLPWPPANNNLFINVGKRRVRSARYDRWIAEALVCAYDQRPKRITGPFNVTLIAERPDKRRRDLDGLFKAPLDLLVRAGLVEDDSLAQQLTIGWSAGVPAKPGCIRITLEAA